jgi:hypothetical protein
MFTIEQSIMETIQLVSNLMKEEETNVTITHGQSNTERKLQMNRCISNANL